MLLSRLLPGSDSGELDIEWSGLEEQAAFRLDHLASAVLSIVLEEGGER